MILQMLPSSPIVFSACVMRDSFKDSRLLLKADAGHHTWRIKRTYQPKDTDVTWAFHIPPTLTTEETSNGIIPASSSSTGKWVTFRFPAAQGGVIRRLRFILGQSPIEEGDVWYCDEGALSRDTRDAYLSRGEGEGEGESDAPPPDSHPAWRVARVFWPSQLHAEEWQEVSIPAVPPSRWWRFIFYPKEQQQLQQQEGGGEGEEAWPMKKRKTWEAPFIPHLQFEGFCA